MKKNYTKITKSHAFDIRSLAIMGALAAISAVLQLAHVGYQTNWGMWIDLVAVTWIIAYFLFGIRAGILVSITGSLIITIFAPFSWVGAIAKLVATIPMILIPFIILKFTKIQRKDLQNIKNLVLVLIISLIIRSFVMVIFNYGFLLPIFLEGKSINEIMNFLPWYIIVILNMIQGVLEVLLAWVLVFRFKLSRFGKFRK